MTRDEPWEPVASQAIELAPLSSTDFGLLEGVAPETASRRKAALVVNAIVGFVFVAMLISNAWLLSLMRTQEIKKASTRTADWARTASAQVSHVISEADRILDVVTYGLGQASMDPDATLRVQELSRHYMRSSTVVGGIYVHDTAGDLVASSLPGLRFNNAHTDHFQIHRQGASTQTAFNPPVLGRASGEWIVPITRRISNPAGQFVGVAVVTVSIRHLQALLAPLDTDASAELTLILSDRVMLRLPVQERRLGQPASDLHLPPLLKTEPMGTFEQGTDEARMIYSFQHVDNYPILVLVGMSKFEALQEWRRDAYIQVAWVLLLAALLWLSAAHMRRSLAQRRKAESRLLETRNQLARANAELSHMAQYDALTGLPNRRYFNEQLHRTFRNAQRRQLVLSIVMVDVDEFKKYNDLYGHVEGDVCLRRVAEALSSVLLRPEDFIARYGGEEIVLLLPETDIAGALSVAQAARLAVLSLHLPHAGAALGTVSVSLGVAAFVPQATSTPEDLLRQADAALYRAKAAGRNRAWSGALADEGQTLAHEDARAP